MAKIMLVMLKILGFIVEGTKEELNELINKPYKSINTWSCNRFIVLIFRNPFMRVKIFRFYVLKSIFTILI